MQVEASFVSYIDLANQTVTSEKAQGAQGDFRGLKASLVASDPDVNRLGKLHVTTTPKTRLKALGCTLIRPFKGLVKGLNQAFAKTPKTSDVQPARSLDTAGACVPLSMAQLQVRMRAESLTSSFAPMGAAKELQEISGKTLVLEQRAMATGNGLLRRVATGINGVVTAYQRKESDPPIHRDQQALVERAQALLDRKIGGLAFSQWATTGGEGERLAALPANLHGQPGAQAELNAAVQCLEDAAAGLRQIAKDVLQLKQDVEAFHHNPAPSMLERPPVAVPVTNKAGETAEFSALFDKLGQSLPDGRNASRVTLTRADMSFMLRSMRQNVISTEGLRSQISTKADLELVRSLYSARELAVVSLDDALREVAEGEGDPGRLLGNFSSALAQFVLTVASEAGGARSPVVTTLASSTPTELRGALALQIREPLQRLDRVSAQHILRQLEGPLGAGVRVVLKTMVEESNAFAQRHKPVSPVYQRANSLVSDMIWILREQLGLPMPPSSPALESGPRHLLTPQEWVALARVMDEGQR